MISRREFLATTGAAVAATSVSGAAMSAPTAAAAGGEKSAKLFLPEKMT